MDQRVALDNPTPVTRKGAIELALRTAGAHAWTHKAAQAYMEQERLRSLSLAQRLLSWNFAVSAIYAFGISSAGLWAFFGLVSHFLSTSAPDTGTAVALFAVMAFAVWSLKEMLTFPMWRKESLKQYAARGTHIPSEAWKLMSNIQRLEPKVRFKVSFLGKDPVLWAEILDSSTNERGGLMYTPLSRPILVWDEAGVVVSPPQ